MKKVIDESELANYDSNYFPGLQNTGIRYYFYLNKGLDILNQFRNLVLGILAFYLALKLENPLWLAILFIPALFLLTITGYYSTHHMSKVMDWLGIRFSTHYAVRQYDYMQRQTEALEEIRDLLKKR